MKHIYQNKINSWKSLGIFPAAKKNAIGNFAILKMNLKLIYLSKYCNIFY